MTVRVTTVSGEVHTFDTNDAEAVIVNQHGDPICRGELVLRMEYSSGVVVDFAEDPPRISTRERR